MILLVLLALAHCEEPEYDINHADRKFTGYEKVTHDASKIVTVHVVPHTHDDVGWLKTVDQYYYGSRDDIYKGGVQYIIDTVIGELVKDPNKTFIYVEIAFFKRWWEEQDDQMKEVVRNLVKTKQLEFINAGYCMNDEASVHYTATVDQMSEGLRWLQREVGFFARPRIAWQIDPFGHSSAQASLSAQMGLEGLFFARMHYQDYDKRKKEQNLEFQWQSEGNSIFTGVLFGNIYRNPAGFCFARWDCHDPPMVENPKSPEYNIPSQMKKITAHFDEHEKVVCNSQQCDLGGISLEFNWLASNNPIFTGVLYRHYNAPPGFCFDRRCTDPPMVANQESPEFNMGRVNDFVKYMDEQASHYRSGNIMLTMGGDFCYQNALKYFKNLDILMKYVNLNTTNNGYKMIYSTPSRYMDAVLANIGPMQTKTDDLFPYADRQHSYWTGYFTSRPALKRYVRDCNRVLQTCKQLEAIVGLGPASTSNTLALAMGVSQHHDAVSGTSKQHVADDYARRLAAGQTECEELMSEAFSTLTQYYSGKFEHCRMMNESVCEATNKGYNQSYTLLVYNPGSQTLQTTIRVPLLTAKYQVISGAGEMYSEFIPTSPETRRLNSKAAPVEGLFNVRLPPLGYQTLRLIPLPNHSTVTLLRPAPLSTEPITVDNKFYVLTFDPVTGSMISITSKLDGVTDKISQRFLEYASSTGTKDDDQASGAYIFRPESQTANDLGTPTLTIHYPGELVTEIWQSFGSWLSQVTRVYRDTPYIEVEWTVGPIPLDHGREIITRYSTSLETNNTFYTDSNGREMLPRVLNYQPTWDYDTSAEPVAANYYPVNSRAALKDLKKGSQLTVLVDRSQGGASLKNGELELMVHRRCLKDDSRGVAEALNETAFGEGLVVRGKHWLVYSGIEAADYLHRYIGQEFLLQPTLVIAQGPLPGGYQQYTALSTDLPKFISLMTWRTLPEDPKVHLIRLENLLAESEGGGPTQVDLAKIFKYHDLKSFEEAALGADRPVSSLTPNLRAKCVSEGTVITLAPFQIRTFYLTFK